MISGVVEGKPNPLSLLHCIQAGIKHFSLKTYLFLDFSRI